MGVGVAAPALSRTWAACSRHPAAVGMHARPPRLEFLPLVGREDALDLGPRRIELRPHARSHRVLERATHGHSASHDGIDLSLLGRREPQLRSKPLPRPLRYAAPRAPATATPHSHSRTAPAPSTVWPKPSAAQPLRPAPRQQEPPIDGDTHQDSGQQRHGDY